MPYDRTLGAFVRHFDVTSRHHGWRLDLFLSRRIPRLSRSHARRIIDSGGVQLTPARRIKPSMVVHTGDIVTLLQYAPEEPVQFDEVEVLLERPSFVALNKPAGMLVHPTARSFQNTLARYLDEHGWPDAGVVHRLDRETSGVIVFARGGDALRRFNHRFTHHHVTKHYLALVLDPDQRHVIGESGVMDVPLGFDQTSPLPTLTVTRGEWPAMTTWLVRQRHAEMALLEVSIEGGRQHQIRAHLAMWGTPLVGDKLYIYGPEFYLDLLEERADPSVFRAPRHALHAWRLGFEELGEAFVIEAPMPAMFERLLGGVTEM